MLRKVTFVLLCIFSICTSEFLLPQERTQEKTSIAVGSPITYMNLLLFSYRGTIDESSFPKLRNMTGLFLINCNLDTLTLPELTNLEYLGLINSTYPAATASIFSNAKNIKHLEVFASPQQLYDFGWLLHLTKLQSFGGHGSKHISTGDGRYTNGLSSLEYFSISGSDVEVLEPSFFDNIPAVKTVDLSNTEIYQITDQTFRSLKDLEYLNLLGTKLGSDFDISVLHQQTKLKTLGLPTEILKKTDFNELKSNLPNLKTLIIFDTEKGSTDVDEVKSKADGKFEISFIPNTITPARDISGVVKFADLPYMAKNQPGGLVSFG